VTSSPRIARILIVEDHPLVREGLRMRIAAHKDLDVCGEAESEEAALELVKETAPELIIVDLSLKHGHGIELIKEVRSKFPSIKTLVISGYPESLYAERALRAGAMGYLNKQESSDKMIHAIRTVLSGRRFASEELTRRLMAQALGERNGAGDVAALLSDRELEVFRLIGQGLTSGAIANRLLLSTHTIDTHRANIKRKLGAGNAAELNRQAVQWTLENG